MPQIGQHILEEVVYMFVRGTKQEIEWLMKTLANGCRSCPYEKECNAQAELDVKRNGEAGVKQTCENFLGQCIKYQIIDE